MSNLPRQSVDSETTLADENRVAPSLLTAEEVAELLRVPTSWVYRAAREGHLPSVRCGRYRRFDPADFHAWIAAQKGLADAA